MRDMLGTSSNLSARGFFELLRTWQATDQIGSDDLIPAILPLLDQVKELHDKGQVAPLDGVDSLLLRDRRELCFDEAKAKPRNKDTEPLDRIDPLSGPVIDVTGEIAVVEAGQNSYQQSQLIAERGQLPNKPLYYLDYTSWEMAVGVHDAVADIFALGMIMGSLATRLDFRDRKQLERFLSVRRNVHAANERIHPVISRVIKDMTALKRRNRAGDLGAIIELLSDYRSAEADDFEDRFAKLDAITEPADRRRQTQDYLKNRLFEITRRNRLIYFQTSSGSVNLTEGSLPYTLDHRNITASQLILPALEFCERLEQTFESSETQWFGLDNLRFENYPHLVPSLDKIRLQAKSDGREYGCSQLYLVLAFLRWHNLGRDGDERIHSPLLLVPVDLRKRQGDHFDLKPLASLRETTVNPALRHHLRETLSLELPETVDITNGDALKVFHAQIERGVQRDYPGVSVHLIENPRITLVQRTVKRTIAADSGRRQRRTGRGLKDYHGLGYSYDPDNYSPLGVLLFNELVKEYAAPDRDMAGKESPAASEAQNPGAERETTRNFYILGRGEESDPMNWEIDLTAVTLSNFNYRKMSLVRDYAAISRAEAGSHAVFDDIVMAAAKKRFAKDSTPGLRERYGVLPQDPSQEDAVYKARFGESYVIQGPPGTGKSQTIANLLADFAARGKKVLFVCEKRVALDVVAQRLQEAGLGDLTCLIHDTREDRRGFIRDLRQIYEAWSKESAPSVAGEREKVIREIEDLIWQLERFDHGMALPANGADQTFRKVVDLVVANETPKPQLTSAQRGKLPAQMSFNRARNAMTEIERLAATRLRGPAQEFLRFLKSDLSQRLDSPAALSKGIAEAISALEAVLDVEPFVPVASPLYNFSLRDLDAQTALAQSLRSLALSEKLNMLDRFDPERARFEDASRRLTQRLAELDEREKESSWLAKMSPREVIFAQEIAARREGKPFAFLHGDWRRLKRRFKACYRGSPLTIRFALAELAAEQEARAEVHREIEALAGTYGYFHVQPLLDCLTRLALGTGRLEAPERALLDHCLREPKIAVRTVIALSQRREAMETAISSLDAFLDGHTGSEPKALHAYLKAVAGNMEAVADLLPLLYDLDRRNPDVSVAWRSLALPLDQFEKATLVETVSKTYHAAPEVERLDGVRLGEIVGRLEGQLKRFRDLNVELTLEGVQKRFRDHHNSNTSMTGRQVLEHQFGLQRPSKTLRELLTEAGAVLRNLKPIWMMSPLSVADTLPLGETLFDAVIFDEASQVSLEDAVPALYRAGQVIVVGDEMQMPPSSFFASSGKNDEPLPDYLAYAVSADSLLTKAAAALPSTKLIWHYRSRHETLISFSNRAFYDGTLNTVPGRQALSSWDPIVVDGPLPDAPTLAGRVLQRPVSFHHVIKGTFHNQQNEAEAKYAAEAVRALLTAKTGKSLGVVAFSQAQANAIESALEALAKKDGNFAANLEAEKEREQDGQFIGLFVKNLENVQGDERDIIIMSVGYAPDGKGKMRMNFGPINQAGGEKRLNVIFSRAKHNVAVISSITADQITNDYNPGPKVLKHYLRYAAAVSLGDERDIHDCLDRLNERKSVARRDEGSDDPVAAHIAAEERGRGSRCASHLGHSDLRVDVAVGSPGDDHFQRAILVDNDAHYAITDVIERYVTRPAILRAFGWKVEQVLGKDLL
jgi:hypothetical protein